MTLLTIDKGTEGFKATGWDPDGEMTISAECISFTPKAAEALAPLFSETTGDRYTGIPHQRRPAQGTTGARLDDLKKIAPRPPHSIIDDAWYGGMTINDDYL